MLVLVEILVLMLVLILVVVLVTVLVIVTGGPGQLDGLMHPPGQTRLEILHSLGSGVIEQSGRVGFWASVGIAARMAVANKVNCHR